MMTTSIRASYRNDPVSLQGFINRHVVFRVEFVKKDGTMRSLLGTVQKGLIPSDLWPTGKGNPNYEEAIPVFDLGKQEWRAFKPANVVDIYSL